MNFESRQRVIDWDAQIDQLKYEEILGVCQDATVDECREAYYRFAQSFHPDAHPDADGVLRQALTRVFQRGVEAYRVLTDPLLRARWGREGLHGKLRLSDLTNSPPIDLAQEVADLHLRCRSAGAKLTSKQAAVTFAQGDFARTVQLLQGALEFEGGANTYLARCLDELGHAGLVR